MTKAVTTYTIERGVQDIEGGKFPKGTVVWRAFRASDPLEAAVTNTARSMVAFEQSLGGIARVFVEREESDRIAGATNWSTMLTDDDPQVTLAGAEWRIAMGGRTFVVRLEREYGGGYKSVIAEVMLDGRSDEWDGTDTPATYPTTALAEALDAIWLTI